MKIAIFDLDMTISDGYSASDVFKGLEKKELIKKGFTNTYLEMADKYYRGEICYNDFATLFYESMLKPYLEDLDVFECRQFIKEEFRPKEKIYNWVEELFQYLHSKDYLISVVTASPEMYLDVLQEELDFDTFYATSFATNYGKYTGEILQIVNDTAKAKYVKQLKKGNYLIGAGDSDGDVEMLKLVDKGVFLLHNDNANIKQNPNLLHIKPVSHTNIMEELVQLTK